ncbi:hypothetical protein BJY01DRAFT_242631 [Aspergillus pseudoustus]|uniref:BTB domain-containing protein n=1 Tax=Aspergillus pseudoustus TaxID=1810923 RepID=A0ABR4KWF8_9EURO
MIRRNTFCPSELPSTAQSFDEFFSISRPHPSQDGFTWTVKRTRACSIDCMDGKPNFEERIAMASGLDEFVEAHIQTQAQIQTPVYRHELAVAQVDGLSEKRKQKKAEKAKKKKKAVRNVKDGGAEGDGVRDENEAENGLRDEYRDDDGNEPGQGKNTCSSEDSPGVREVTVVYGDGRRGRTPQEEEQAYVEQVEDVGEDRDAGLQREEATENPLEEEEENEEPSNLACLVHGRLLCQFNISCCVHRPVQEGGCACPPRYSCCCMHHAGDCCTCRSDILVARDGDDNPSKTVSAAPFTPATPTTNAAADTPASASATVSTTASASSPSNPANVKLMVTPASPSAMKCVEPVVMGGAEDAGILAAQASLELSTALLGMLDIGHVSDFRLTLRSSTDQFLPIHMTAHRCILARSPLVSSLLHHPYYSHELVALACEHFSMVKPWEQVVHYLYGRPMLTTQTLKPVTLEGLGYDPFPDRGCEPEYPFSVQAAMLDMALGYAVCGAFFYLPIVVDTGFGLALDLISWETVEHIMFFGLCTYKFAVILPAPSWPQSQPHDLSQDVHHGAHAHAATAENTETDTPGQEEYKVPETSPNTSEISSAWKPVPIPIPALAEMYADASQLLPYPIYLLESDWSHRITTAALNFLLDHVTPGFKIYCGAKSDLVPDRIPDYLRAPSSVPKKSTEKATEGQDSSTSTTTPTPTTSSFALAHNPRLAEVKFGFFPSSDGEVESNTDEQPKPKTKSQKRREKEREKKRLQEEQARAAATPVQNVAALGPEVTITSAVLLSIGYYHLQLTFRMLSERHVLTPSLARSIIMEREARRRAALQRYAEMVLANKPSAGASANASHVADGTTTTGDDTSGGGSKKKAKSKKGKEKENVDVSVNVVNLQDEVRELCYREFFASKTKVGPRAAGQTEVEVEIVLQREWVGIEQ